MIDISRAQEILKVITAKSSVTIEQQLLPIISLKMDRRNFFHINVLVYASDFLLAYSKIPKWPFSLRAMWYSKKFRDSFKSLPINNFILPPLRQEFNKFAGKNAIHIGLNEFLETCSTILSSKHFKNLRKSLKLNSNENRVFINIYERVLTQNEINDLKKFITELENTTKISCLVILKLHPSIKITQFELAEFETKLHKLKFNVARIGNSLEFAYLPIELLLASSQLNNYFFGPLSGGVLTIDRSHCFFTYPEIVSEKKFMLVVYSQFLKRWQKKNFLLRHSSLIK
jgi:hypothetical protein